MEGKKWQDWLTSIGTVIALILGGVTFYYQFLRAPRELSAVIFPARWAVDGTCTVRVVIWNDGTRDEVLEGAYLVVQDPEKGQTIPMPRHLFGSEIIRPGEAKQYVGVAKVDQELAQRIFAQSFVWFPKTREELLRTGKEVGLSVRFVVIDRSGQYRVVESPVGQIVRRNAYARTIISPTSTRVDLVTGKSVKHSQTEEIQRD